MREVHNATQHLKISIYDTDNPNEQSLDVKGPSADQTSIIDQVKRLLDRKLDKQEYGEEIRTKLSKKDHEMSLQTINMMHKQL